MDRFMRLAFSLAKKTNPYPNPRVGAVLVKDGKIIGTGYHRKAGMPHAEVEAIEDAKRNGGRGDAVKGATLYVTLEPCSHTMKRTAPCTEVIISHGIKRVVYAMKDPNPLVDGTSVLRQAGVAVVGPTDEKETRRINRRYLANIMKKPFVVMKMAMSADGKTATRTGDSKWITGKEAREYVHRMRASFDAVMVGANTVIMDDPELTTHNSKPATRNPKPTTRNPKLTKRNPYRVIVDGRLKIPLDAEVLRNHDGKTIIAASEKAPEDRIRKIADAGRGVRIFVCGKKDVDLSCLVSALGAMGMKRILIEGGSELNARALDAGIVDRVHIFIAPKIIGGMDAKPVVGGLGIARMKDAMRLSGMRIKRLGPDILIEYDVGQR
ncbi:bifunctional diaminohydroxyphosphoribosylaminopyrimidine deaminase/5-amino-6-(5-phosphoribosylamino)uracil reductase RibD [Candidatus Micrarchaeota archaeon]|nr:bifunctional diaminohydroxyphosphoribosylaminopyrimidine deaminase/5-amino-6-(5-phosphoribosylamino)uracil reductase RibD [Candidatus Micrarchaeota archaeon]